MVSLVGLLVFGAALAVAVAIIGATVVPALPRIVSLLAGRGDPVWDSRPLLAVSARRSARVRTFVPLARPIAAGSREVA